MHAINTEKMFCALFTQILEDTQKYENMTEPCQDDYDAYYRLIHSRQAK